ncbi:MAG: hypothetical protein QNJ51_09035 [Calothrix sp. MO_167.B12]|nr:hypothetical protein [Calothrix sp. MO_167.B12]
MKVPKVLIFLSMVLTLAASAILWSYRTQAEMLVNLGNSKFNNWSVNLRGDDDAFRVESKVHTDCNWSVPKGYQLANLDSISYQSGYPRRQKWGALLNNGMIEADTETQTHRDTRIMVTPLFPIFRNNPSIKQRYWATRCRHQEQRWRNRYGVECISWTYWRPDRYADNLYGKLNYMNMRCNRGRMPYCRIRATFTKDDVSGRDTGISYTTTCCEKEGVWLHKFVF